MEKEEVQELGPVDDRHRLYWDAGTSYDEFLEQQHIPIHTGYAAEAKTVEVDDWDLTGGKGAILSLEGHEGLNDIQVHEIPPGEELNEMEPLSEEIVYVLSGSGATHVNYGDDEYVFEWNEDSMFFLPRNIRYRHISLSEEPVRFVVDSDLPALFRMYRDEEYIYHGGGQLFADPDDYSSSGRLFIVPGVPGIWEANFIPSISGFDELQDYSSRGAGGANIKFRFPQARSLRAHMSEFPVGTYKKAHRHSGGTSIITISGEGYTLMWPPNEEEDRVRVDWEPGSIVVPPTGWWHQNFNLSDSTARYLALYAPNVGPDTSFLDPKEPFNQIGYAEEDPEIRELFEEELAKRGIETRMPKKCYTDSDHDFNMSYEDAKQQAD